MHRSLVSQRVDLPSTDTGQDRFWCHSEKLVGQNRRDRDAPRPRDGRVESEACLLFPSSLSPTYIPLAEGCIDLYQWALLCRARLQYQETVNQLETQAGCVAWLVPGVPLSEVVRSPPARRGPPGRCRQFVQAVPRHHTASQESAP